MFLRKLTVMVVPLLLAVGLCLLFPLMNWGFFGYVAKGLLLGGALALLLPLSGAGRKKEPFAGLLWVPTLVLTAVLVYQYLASTAAVDVPVLSMLTTRDGSVVLLESGFVGYMALTSIRTKR